MTTRYAARYLIGWIVFSTATAAIAAVIAGRLGVSDVRSVLTGVSVAAVADLISFALHAYGLFVAPGRFMLAWGASVAARFVIFSGAIGWAAMTPRYDARLLAIGCATGFVVLVHHEAFVICRDPDPRRKSPTNGSRPKVRLDV